MIRWIEVLRYLLKYKMQAKLAKVMIFYRKENFWKFEDWVKLENRYGLKSAMYFCGLKGNLLRYFLKALTLFMMFGRNNLKGFLII